MKFYANVEWARNPHFRAYWEHYDACEKWRKKHMVNSKKAECLASPSTSKTSENRKVRRKEKQNVWNVEEIQSQLNETEKFEELEEEVVEEEEQKEMSDEMKAFFEKTMQHRKERDSKRIANLNEEKSWLKEEDDDYVNIDKIKIRGRTKKSAKPVNEQAATIEKREKSRKMYGISSDQIMAMETVLELNFENEYAKSEPQMWPNIPFRF